MQPKKKEKNGTSSRHTRAHVYKLFIDVSPCVFIICMNTEERRERGDRHSILYNRLYNKQRYKMKGQSYYLIVAMLLIAILSNTLIDGKKTIPKSKNIHKKTDDDNVNKNGNKDVIDDEDKAGGFGDDPNDMFGWKDWRHAFELTDSDEDGKLHLSDINALFKEHFNKIHAGIPHASGGDRVTREVEDVFLEEAKLFTEHVKGMGSSDVKTFDFKEFKSMMTMFMHARADVQALLDKAQDL